MSKGILQFDMWQKTPKLRPIDFMIVVVVLRNKMRVILAKNIACNQQVIIVPGTEGNG